MDESPAGFKPPYISFQTFWSFLTDLSEKPLPPQIDRGVMSGKSGTDQNNLIAAMSAFGLIGDHNRVIPERMAAMVSKEEAERIRALEFLVRAQYADAIDLSNDNGTEQQLHEVFRDKYGLSAVETRRKCVTFFLHAARKAEIPLSAHFPQTRSGSGAPGVPRKKPASRRNRSVQDSGKVRDGATGVVTRVSGERRTVDFGAAGSVVIDVDVRWLDLPGETFLKLRKIVADLEALGSAPASTSAVTEEAVS